MDLSQSSRALQEPELQSQLPELSANQESAQQFNIEYAELFNSQLIGYGRYGRVYQHDCNGITVAVKDVAVSAKEIPRLDRLRREGKIHMKLRHRNIITLFDTQQLQQNLLLVMEFAAGGSLSDVLEKHIRLLESSVVTDWAAQIAKGMSYLHDKDIVHRDLKSSNILVLEPIDDSGLFGKTLKIADFGLACDGHDKTRTMSEAGGTRCCMAPEVLEPPHRFSKASDVYSFGVVVGNLLTGKEPSKDLENSFRVENKHLWMSPFYDRLLKECCTTEHWKRPTFRNIVDKFIHWQGQTAVESLSIALCNEEFGGVSNNVIESASAAPSPSQLNKQQVLQQASLSPPPSWQQQSFSFGAALVSFTLPVNCLDEDVALTQDGRSLLLAAQQHGLIELSSTSGRELSRWRPPRYSSSLDDEVLAVAALAHRRAAVSVRRAQLVALLRRNEESSCSSTTGGAAAAATVDDSWIEDRRIQLPWSAHRLSAHDEVLAASWGQRLQLLSLRSGRPLTGTEMQRDYWIGSLAVADRVLVTGSYCKVELGGGRRAAHVLDAHSLDADGSSDTRLWRHELLSSSSDRQQEEDEIEEPGRHVLSSSCRDRNQQEEEGDELWGVCADTSGGCLYAALNRRDNSSGRVSALSLADGSELRSITLSFSYSASLPQPLLLPVRLSLSDDRVDEQQQGSSSSSSRRSGSRMLLLAVLCCDAATRELRTVTLHRGTSDTLQ